MWVNILGTNHTKPLVLFACGTNNKLSIIIILAATYGGLTVSDVQIALLVSQPWGCYYCCAHFANEKLEAWWGQVIYPRTYPTSRVEELGFKPGLLDSKSCASI